MADVNEKKNTRLEVLKLKLRNYSPEQIAEKLNIRVVVVHKYIRDINSQMGKETATELSNMKPEDLEVLATTATALMPYMEKTMAKVNEGAVKLQALHGDTVDNAELIQACLNIILTAEVQKESPDLNIVSRVSVIVESTNRSFFNKEGIQIVQIMNDNSNNVVVQQKAERMKKLQEMMGVTTETTEQIIDAEVEDKESDE